MGLRHLQLDQLRFAVIGSVDDGKSTLIGRLFYDTHSLVQDQIESLRTEKNSSELNLAHLTDGLKDEREQGITIDVAYRFFSTEKRKFIVVDCPGHIEYTRNMVTGVSHCNAAVILIDAMRGIRTQTKRHAFITSLIGVKHLVVCVNKIDLVSDKEKVFEDIKNEFITFMSQLSIPDVAFIPVSALSGDNVVEESKKMPWYNGPSLLSHLENLFLVSDDNHLDCRFPVQRVIRANGASKEPFRGYAGCVESGVFKKGDEVLLLPSQFKTHIAEIFQYKNTLEEAFTSMSVVMTLEGDFELSRGDMIVKQANSPQITEELELMVCWLNQKAFNQSTRFALKHTTKQTQAYVEKILYKLNIETLKKEEVLSVEMNDIVCLKVQCAEPLFVDKYKINKNTGSLILIDTTTNETVGAGFVL